LRTRQTLALQGTINTRPRGRLSARLHEQIPAIATFDIGGDARFNPPLGGMQARHAAAATWHDASSAD
jgi:hypothetical protein